ncbi:MAG: GTP 3',8-cyclase MoaA [Desulfobacterales bacterium]
MHSKLIDRYHRNLNYLRISITDRCNLRCLYCMPRGLIPKLSHKEILRYEEILRIARVGINLGISKIRITGGEPLVRKGVDQFLKQLAKTEGIKDISLTTNGVLLKDHIHNIKAAGIKRINISLDTLNKQKFKHITGYDFFDQIWEGIELARKMGFYPIKINVVPLKGVNDDELASIAELSVLHPFHVRFIEYMPMGSNQVANDRQILFPEIKKRIQSLGKLIPVDRNTNDGPAERFKFESAQGEIGFIRPISRHFCGTCNRLRLTASGQLRPCLMSDNHEDLKSLLRKGCSDKALAKGFLRAVRHKPLEHRLTKDHHLRGSAQMCAIGG